MKKKVSQKIPYKLVVLSWVPTLISLAVVIAVMIPAIQFFVPSGSLLCIVDGSSMDITLHDGQIMFQDGTDFSRGDIVTCIIPETEGSSKTKIIVKRVVGMPGESVSIDAAGVYINGQRLAEDYLTADAAANTYREHLRSEAQLGPEEYFLMGDNRLVSYDSRYFGAIARDDMLYKVNAKPGVPFLLAAGKLLVIGIIAVFANTLLDDLLTKLISKKNPELARYLEEEAKKRKKQEAPKDTE